MGARSLREGCGLLQCKLDRFKRFSAAAGVRTAENGEKQCKTVSLAPKRPLQLSKFKFLNSKQNLNCKPLVALLTSNITSMKHLRSMGAGEASTDEKTSKNSAEQCRTVSLAPKRPLQLSKFKYSNSKFAFQASSCITNLKCHI